MEITRLPLLTAAPAAAADGPVLGRALAIRDPDPLARLRVCHEVPVADAARAFLPGPARPPLDA